MGWLRCENFAIETPQGHGWGKHALNTPIEQWEKPFQELMLWSKSFRNLVQIPCEPTLKSGIRSLSTKTNGFRLFRVPCQRGNPRQQCQNRGSIKPQFMGVKMAYPQSMATWLYFEKMMLNRDISGYPLFNPDGNLYNGEYSGHGWHSDFSEVTLVPGNLSGKSRPSATSKQYSLSVSVVSFRLLVLSPEFSWEKFVVCRFSSPYFPSGWRDKCTKNCWFPTDVPMNQPHETHCWCLPAPKS